MTARLARALRMFGHAVDVACTAVADGIEMFTFVVPDTVPTAWVSDNAEWCWSWLDEEGDR